MMPRKLLGATLVVLAVAFAAGQLAEASEEKEMAITFNSQTTLVRTVPTTAHTISTPAAAAVTKVMVAYLLVGTDGVGNVPVITPPAGWTELGQIDRFGSTFTMHWAMRVVKANEPEPPSYTWTTNLAVKSCHAILLYNDASSPIPDAHGFLIDGFPLEAPSITTVVANVMVLRSASAEGGAQSWTGFPAGTLRLNLNMAVDADPEKEVTLAVVEEGIQASPGPTGTAGFSNSFGAQSAMATTSIAPGPPGGGPRGERPKQPVTKAEVLAAREHAKAIGAKVKTKFDQRRR